MYRGVMEWNHGSMEDKLREVGNHLVRLVWCEKDNDIHQMEKEFKMRRESNKARRKEEKRAGRMQEYLLLKQQQQDIETWYRERQDKFQVEMEEELEYWKREFHLTNNELDIHFH